VGSPLLSRKPQLRNNLPISTAETP